jgi:hypothetical protein
MNRQKRDWFDRAEYRAIRTAAFILLIAALVRFVLDALGLRLPCPIVFR